MAGGPTMGGQAAGSDWLVRELQNLRRDFEEYKSARTLEAATIGAGGIRTANFDGTSFANPGTVGNYFGFDGAVLNALFLRAGSVSNDALTNPVTFAFYEGATNSVTLTVAGSYLNTGTISVPTGFTKALVFSHCTVGGTNSTGAADNIYCSPTINTTNGQLIPQGVTAGFAGTVSMTQALLITPPALGATIQVKVWGAVDHSGWTGGNGHISAFVIFTR